MRILKVRPSGVECFFGEDDIIVSKTDTRGIITYANDVFQRVSGYSEAELLGQPHNLIRHPEMPMCVFRLLWQTIAAGKEIFAYVVNQAKNGDHYWVFAHVTPTFDRNGRIVGYHSNRRTPSRTAVASIKQVYAALLAEERKCANSEEAIEAGLRLLNDTLQQKGMGYEEFIFSLEEEEATCSV
jgi:PAS domain S-box-containing protein